MLDIHTLERRWLKYKIKSYAPYISTVAVLVLSITAFSVLNENKSESAVTKDQNNSSEKAPSSLEKTNDSESSNVLEPSMEFVQSFQPSEPEIQAPTANDPKKEQLTHTVVPIPKVLNVPDSGQIQPIAVSSSAINDNKPSSLNRNETKMDIESVVRRFKDTSDPNLGLFIARYYYAQSNYNEAYNFALKTNNLNTKMDESWIIFSKSLVKLGKVDQAKKTLKLYIAESNSDTARALLDSIEQGTFK